MLVSGHSRSGSRCALSVQSCSFFGAQKKKARRSESSPGLLLLPYLSCSEVRAGNKTPLSVPCDDRRRATITTPIEPVVQADAHDVIALTEKVVVVEEEIVVVVGTTNVGVEILGFDAPIIVKGPFNAGADGVAD